MCTKQSGVDWRRREFLRTSMAGLSAAAVAGSTSTATAEPSAAADDLSPGFIDVNVYLSRWPFRRMRGDEPKEFVEMLRSRSVMQAWAGSFEAPFHKDLAAVNTRLSDACRQHGEGMLVPFGCVDPTLPDWEEELRRCHEDHQMPGIRLHPNYHQYKLDDPAFERLVTAAAERRLIVQVVPWLEDRRHHNPLMPVADADLSPLVDVVAKLPELRLVLLNGFRTVGGKSLLKLFDLPQVYCDIALLDVIDGVADLLERAPAERVLFGSYAPMFYFEAAPLKLKESVISDAEMRAICIDNARRLLPSAESKSLLP